MLIFFSFVITFKLCENSNLLPLAYQRKQSKKCWLSIILYFSNIDSIIDWISWRHSKECLASQQPVAECPSCFFSSQIESCPAGGRRIFGVVRINMSSSCITTLYRHGVIIHARLIKNAQRFACVLCVVVSKCVCENNCHTIASFLRQCNRQPHHQNMQS